VHRSPLCTLRDAAGCFPGYVFPLRPVITLFFPIKISGVRLLPAAQQTAGAVRGVSPFYHPPHTLSALFYFWFPLVCTDSFGTRQFLSCRSPHPRVCFCKIFCLTFFFCFDVRWLSPLGVRPTLFPSAPSLASLRRVCSRLSAQVLFVKKYRRPVFFSVFQLRPTHCAFLLT